LRFRHPRRRLSETCCLSRKGGRLSLTLVLPIGVVLGHGHEPETTKTDTFLGEKYRRIARRRGSKRAIVALGRSILVITWHLLSDPGSHFSDLGPGYHAARIDPERRKQSHIRQLEALGYTVTLEPAA
jgi:hypothetical protein